MGKITDYPSITNIGNDTILLGDGSSGTGKVAASELAQYALEEYAGSTVGGAAQSAKAALDNMSKGIIGYASEMNLDALNTESVCGVYWINLEDSTLSGTKPGSSGQGMIFVKKQTENLYRQVYVPVTEGADYKSRYYSHSAGTWSAWAYTPMGTAINTVFGATTIKTLTASDNLLTLAVGHYRINNAVPINAPDSSLKYGYVTIQNRGANGYTYYEYAVGNGNGTSFKIYHGWKASGSATTIDWAEKKIYEDISALNSNTTYALNYNGMSTIAKSDDLNSYTTPGSYVAPTTSTTSTLTNCPINDSGFSLHVESVAGGSGQFIFQTIKRVRSGVGEIYIRTFTGTIWGAWLQLSYAS